MMVALDQADSDAREIMMAPQVLVVDDDDNARQSLATGLRDSGLQVQDVPEGQAALALLAEQRFDLALVDLMMPGLNGLQLIRKVAIEHPHLPILLMSGYHLSRKQLEQIGLNAVAFVPKPYPLGELVDFVWRKTGKPRPLRRQLRSA
jgi:CheY-like chemotaxis protein